MCPLSRKGLRQGPEFGFRFLSDWEIDQGELKPRDLWGSPADWFLLNSKGKDGSVRPDPASERLFPTGNDGPMGTD